jgi:hypothetical protein
LRGGSHLDAVQEGGLNSVNLFQHLVDLSLIGISLVSQVENFAALSVLAQEPQGLSDVPDVNGVDSEVLGVQALHLLSGLLVDGSDDETRG